MTTSSVKNLLETAAKENLPLWEVILNRHCADELCTREQALSRMEGMWRAMYEASEDYKGSDRSASGLSGGDGEKLSARTGNFLGGDLIGTVIIEAVKMGECNACMKRIVAAPTAGSCGVLPAVLIALKRHKNVSDDEIVKAMFTAAGFGQVIASRASVSGAEGGCQAEIGSASAMTAAAVVSVMGGSPDMCASAAAFALQSFLGLVCDPVAGLVEVPCIMRGASGAVTAVMSADIALAGVTSRVPCDEVIDAMREIGDAMPAALKETSQGGLALTPAAQEVVERLAGIGG